MIVHLSVESRCYIRKSCDRRGEVLQLLCQLRCEEAKSDDCGRTCESESYDTENVSGRELQGRDSLAQYISPAFLRCNETP